MMLSRDHRMLHIGIIGAGLIGRKRAAALPGATLVAVADKIPERAKELAAAYRAEYLDRWQDLVRRPDIDAVVVATTNAALAECSIAALDAGKHVLVEKPAGCRPEDAIRQREAAEKSGRVLRVGFNHRFHPALRRAKSMIDAGAIGPVLYVRARYGHGGRVGYDREWRADP